MAVLTLAPVVLPIIVSGHVTGFEGGAVDAVFLFDPAIGIRVDNTLGVVVNGAIHAIRVGGDIEFVIVVGVGFSHRIHTIVAADAVVQEHAAIATWATAHVLADKIGHE